MQIKRDKYLNELKLRMNNDLVKIVTGIRRCGKSYLLNELFYQYLLSKNNDREHIITLSFEGFDNIELREPRALDDYVKSKIKDAQNYYLLIDEIQEVKDFVLLLNSWLKIKNLDIYITGSNSRFLSSDIATEFRGRGDVIYLSPLSFAEYFSTSSDDFDIALDKYVIYGGMPYLQNRDTDKMKVDYLKSLFKEIYLKDIADRYKIRNYAEFEELLNIISSSIGGLTNPYKLEKTFKSVKNVSISKNTIESYLNILEETFLIKKAQRYDLKGKKYISSTNKYYFTDLGLRNARLNFRQIELPHLIENLIYNELVIKGYDVDVGVVEVNEKNESGNFVRKQTEIDFVANIANDRIYFQSAFSINDDAKLAQETRPFQKLGDSFRKFIIVRDNIIPRRDDAGISTISLKDFLLRDDALSI